MKKITMKHGIKSVLHSPDSKQHIYFLSFVEEGVMNSDFYGYRGGRIEVSKEGEQWPVEEIRFLFNASEDKKLGEWIFFREKYDFEYLTKEELDIFRKVVQRNFLEEEELWKHLK